MFDITDEDKCIQMRFDKEDNMLNLTFNIVNITAMLKNQLKYQNSFFFQWNQEMADRFNSISILLSFIIKRL